MSTLKRRLVLATILVVGAVACGVGGAAIASVLSGCGPAAQQPLVPANPDGANCLAERQMLQLTCVEHYSTRPAIEKCIADAKLPDCTTEAGIAQFVASRDAGATKP